MKKLLIIILLFISYQIVTAQKLYWIDTSGGKQLLREVGNKYPLPIQIRIIDKDTSKQFQYQEHLNQSIPVKIYNCLIDEKFEFYKKEDEV
jgi:hypothetical protein